MSDSRQNMLKICWKLLQVYDYLVNKYKFCSILHVLTFFASIPNKRHLKDHLCVAICCAVEIGIARGLQHNSHCSADLKLKYMTSNM
jgi:hypothetical protein